MAVSFGEAIARVSATGQPFEVVEAEVGGVTHRVFKNAPATLRDYFDPARGVTSTFLVYEGEEWTFDRVMAEADALGAALVERYGVGVGDRVGIAMRNLPEWVVAFCAILSVGAVSVSLNAWWVEDEIAFAIADSTPRVLLADAERAERARRPCAAAGVPIVVARAGDEAPGLARWEDVVVRGSAPARVDLHPDLDATILYTSGTTGYPKGAVSTHRALSQALMAFASRAAIDSMRRDSMVESPDAMVESPGNPPCFILIVPLFHVTGCVPVMLSCFAWHFRLVMMHRWDPARALELIERHRVTAFVGVPTQSWDLLECPRFAEFDTSSLSSVGGGGAPAPPALVERIDRSFTRGRPGLGYGMTETNAYGPGNYADDYVAHPTSTGRVPTIVMDVAVRDDEGRDVEPGGTGEIWLKSPTTFRGYWGRPEDTAAALRDGWLRTGDLGRVDADGYLYIEDRIKDMILRAGENVYCAEVEAALYEHPAVFEAAVFGLPDERLGEAVAAAVVLREGADLDEDSLHDFLAARLAAYMIPSRVAFSAEPLPRNAAGKFLKREMPGRYFA